MAKVRLFEMAKYLGVKTHELVDILYENDIIKNNFSKIDGNDLACICHLLFIKNNQLLSIDSEDCDQTIIKKILNPKYHNSLKFLVHMLNDKEKRKKIICQIALLNPLFSTQILTTICDNIEEEREYLLELLQKIYSCSGSEYKRYLLIMAMLELEKYEEIKEIFKEKKELADFCKTLKLLERLSVNTEKQLVLIELFIKFNLFDEVDVVLKEMEDTDDFDTLQAEKAFSISKSLKAVGRLDLSYRLLVKAGYNQTALEVIKAFDVNQYCNNRIAINNYFMMLKAASNKRNNSIFSDTIKKQLEFICLLLNSKLYSILKNEFNIMINEVLTLMEETNYFNLEYGNIVIKISKTLEAVGRFDLAYRLLIIADLKNVALQVLNHVKLESFNGRPSDVANFYNALKKSTHLAVFFIHDRIRLLELVEFLLRFNKLEEVREVLFNVEDARNSIDFYSVYRNIKKQRKGLKEYLELKYNLKDEDINNVTFWQNVINSENKSGIEFRSMLTKTLRQFEKKGQLSVIVKNEILKILSYNKSVNLNQEKNNELKSNITSSKIFISENRIDKKLISYSDNAIGNNKQYHSFLKDENNFSKDNELKAGLLKDYVYIKENDFNNKESSDNSYESFNLFNICLHKYMSEENFIRLYFNSPLKLDIKFEYLIEKIKDRFNCKNKKLKFILKEYLIKGKISEINESYITIRPLNINTEQECRMNLKGCILKNDKQNEFLQNNRICYFMFDYMKEVNNKKVFFVQLANI